MMRVLLRRSHGPLLLWCSTCVTGSHRWISTDQHKHQEEHRGGSNHHSNHNNSNGESAGGGGSSASTPQRPPPSVAEMHRAFTVFGIAHTSSYADIRKRFLALTKAHHPDIVCPIAAAAAVAAAAEGGGEASGDGEGRRSKERGDAREHGGGGGGASIPTPASSNESERATEKMSCINEAYETLRRAHAACRLPDDQKRKHGPSAASNNNNHGSHHRGTPASASSASRGHKQNHGNSAAASSFSSSPSWSGRWPFGFGGRAAQEHTTDRTGSAASSHSNGSSDAPEDGVDDDGGGGAWFCNRHDVHCRPPNPTIRADASRRSLRFLYNEATPALRNPFIETKEDEAPNFEGYYHERTYAKTVSGKTVTTQFDIATKSFVLVFCGDPFCESNVTKIVLHEDLHYPNGFSVHLAVTTTATRPGGDAGCSSPPGGTTAAAGKAGVGQKKNAAAGPTASACAATATSPAASMSSHLARWRHVSKDLVEVEHDRTKVGLARLQVTVYIQACPTMASPPPEASSSSSSAFAAAS